ncbi:MAG: hypothetical protein ACRD29_22310 [Acidimicrobiales bacterium]
MTTARRLAHLVRRFVGSLVPAGPSARDDGWARAHLLPGEIDLWDRMSRADRRHAVAVARAVDRRLKADASRPVVAAALLHDVGKVEAGLGTFGRVAATVVVAARGHRRTAAWSNRPGLAGRIGRYVLHPDLGALLLAGAGSDPLTMAWALEHHRRPDEWTVPREIGEALKAADDD